MKITYLVCLIFLIGCNTYNFSHPKNIEDLKVYIDKCIKNENLSALSKISYNIEKPYIDFLDNYQKNIRNKTYTIEVTDYYPGSLSTLFERKYINWKVKPIYYLRILHDSKNGWNISLGLPVGEINGFLYLLTGGEKIKSNSWPKREFKLIMKKPVLKDRVSKNKTYEFSWDGETFTSASMDNLSVLLSNELGSKVINQTNLEGDYDFTMKFSNLKSPSEVKLDLKKIGLDLLLLK